MGEVGDDLRQILDQFSQSQQRIRAIAADLATLRQQLAGLTQGADDHRVGEAQARMRLAVQRLEEAIAGSRSVSSAIVSYLAGMGVTAPLPLATEPASSATTTVPTGTSTSDDLVEEARQSLFPGVRGAQTQGRWVTTDGQVEDLRSGKDDDWYAKAKAFAASLPAHLRAASRLAVHLETKFAVRMREEGRMRETIVIDREVCGRGATDQQLPYTCDKQLGRFLPPGAVLTVVEHDGTRRTYRGETNQ